MPPTEDVTAPVMSEHNSVVREPNAARPDFNERVRAMREAAAVEAEDDDIAEEEGDEDAEVETEPSSPKALRPGKPKPAAEPPTKLSKIKEKLDSERARLKTKRAEDNQRSSIEEERAALRAEAAAFKQLREQLHERVSKIDPDDPVALERILEKLGGERVSKFIVAQGDPAIRAQQQQQVAPPPRSQEEDDRVARLEAQVNQYFAGQKKQADEQAFVSRVSSLGHDDEGGAPFTAALMSKSPAKAMKMAYAVMADIVEEKQRAGKPVVFDDDDIIIKMEEELSEYAALRNPSPQKQASGLSSRTRQTEQDEPDPADAPAADERVTKTRSKLSPKEALARRVEAARRQMNALDRSERRR